MKWVTMTTMTALALFGKNSAVQLLKVIYDIL